MIHYPKFVFSRPRLGQLSLGLVLALGLANCEKKETPTPSAGSTATTEAVVEKKPSWVDHSAKLGFASQLPVSTELYFGSVGLKAHLDALKKTAFWKDASAFFGDKIPAPTAGDTSAETFQSLFGDDVFIAGAAGFGKSALLLKDFNRIYNEVYFKALMTGGAASLQGTPSANPMLVYLQTFMGDAAALEKVSNFAAKFELPPLIIGAKVEKPEEILAKIFTPEVQKQWAEKNVIVTDLKTSQGHVFKVATLEMEKVLPADGKEKMLASLSPELPEASRKIIEKAYDDIRVKKFSFAWGNVGPFILFATGQNFDHLQFAADPATSFLSKPELASLLPNAGKNLTTLAFIDDQTLHALQDEQPLVPMLRGLVSAMKENPLFGELGNKLDEQITELSPLEAATFSTKNSDLVGLTWWDKGLHGESFGGPEPRFFESGEPLKFASLIKQPGVVFGIDFHRNPAYEKDVTAWSEKLFSIVYTGAQELIKAGIAGPDGGQKFAMFELMFLPIVQKVYEANKDIDNKGLGSEAAYVLDVNGKAPEIPGVLAEDKDMKFPRITSIRDVANRGEVAKGWQTINDTLTGIATLLGAAAPPTEPGAPAGFALPVAQSADIAGMTMWSYPSPFFSGDLLPNATINDKVLVLSTSKEASETIAAELAKPAASNVEGCLWRFDLGALANFISAASALAPDQTPDKTKEIQQNLKWLRPFHAAEGRIFPENGVWRSTFSWEITDPVSFD